MRKKPKSSMRAAISLSKSPGWHLDEGGQALILIVFAIVALVGITGLAVDGGNAYSDRRKAQSAADSAALAGALGRVNGGVWLNLVYQAAATNGYNNNGKTNTVQVYSPPISGTYKGNLEYIQVRITSHVRTYFASVVGRSTITNTVESVARAKPSHYGPMFGGAAIVSLAPSSDCVNHKSFYVHAEATLDIFGGDVLVNSVNPTCALIQQGEGSIRINDEHKIQIGGGASIQKPKLITPYPPTENVGAMPYPPPVFMPKVGCGNKEAEVSWDGTSMTPGAWGGGPFPPDDVTYLEPGVYCLDGDFTLLGNHPLTGSNVVFYLKKGQLRWSGASLLKLSAPNKGEYKGLLIYQPIENKNPMILNAAEESTIKGTILAPGADVKVKGNDSKYGYHSQIIGYTIDVDGDSNVVLMYADDDNFFALTMPQVQFVH